jgi:hypothetical protein
MRQLLARFWREEDGFVVAGDLVFVATILILGAAFSVLALRASLQEDVVDAIPSAPASEAQR